MKNDRLLGYVIAENSGISVKPTIISRTDKTITFDAILQESDKENRNGRIYPASILEAGFKSAYVKERLITNSWKGEAEHPEGDDMQRLFRVEPNNTSHFIKSWSRDGNMFMGRIQTAASRVGEDYMNMILENDMLTAFSLRGTGPVRKENGKNVVSGPFRMITYDSVMHPSHQQAYAASNLSESVQESNFGDSHCIELRESDIEYMAKNDNFLIENLDYLNALKDTKYSVKNGNIIAINESATVAVNISRSTKYLLHDMFNTKL